MNKNVSLLLAVAVLLFIAFFIGRCAKNPQVVEKIVEKEVISYPDDEPLPQVIVEREVEYVLDRKKLDEMARRLEICNDSIGIMATLLLSEQLLGHIEVRVDTLLDSVFVEVEQRRMSDTKKGENWSLGWDIRYKGTIDSLVFDVEANCPGDPGPYGRSIAFGAALKSTPGLDLDFPLSFSLEKDGIEKGLTYYPIEKAASIDLKYRFKYRKFSDLFRKKPKG